MTTTSETQGLVEQFDPAALALAAAAPDPAAPEAPAPSKRSSRKSVLALSVCALAINGSAAIYTLPFDFPSPNRAKIGSGCRCLEGYSVGPAATHGFAAGEQPRIAAKCRVAAAGFNGAPFSATEHHGRTVRCEEDIFAAIYAHSEGRLAAKCNDVGRHVLHSKSACSLWTVRSDAQTDGSAVEICRAYFGWRSSPDCAGYNFSPGKLKHVKQIARDYARASSPAGSR